MTYNVFGKTLNLAQSIMLILVYGKMLLMIHTASNRFSIDFLCFCSRWADRIC